MAISRLQAALAAATSEVTVAAANLNFDFTLVKYEAPKEYQPLGNILSTKRKDSAELGSSHKLARQLGALFEDVCPPAPRLLEAYGKRASEIAKASQNTSDSYTGTLFDGFAGIDGTSIWAAATSSKSALHIHLLASLLARMWTAPEAISIWVELVAERRKDIATRIEEGEPVKFSLAAAVGQEITRSQLADWDASARAWLRTADKVFERKQKQLELILKNIHLSVGGDLEVFPSVIEAWVTATETMERLIAGMPQAAQDGAPLLGLSAWHLYPDMGVFSPEVVEIKMDDPLVAAGGFLSIGLATTPRTSSENNGVYWSLSLAQLRFYGKPVKVERALENGSRITFPQLNLVLFGILLAEWRMNDSDGNLAAQTVISLVDYVIGHKHGSISDRRLLKMLRDSAIAFTERTTGDKELNAKLIQLGRRRAQNMVHGDGLESKTEITPVFFNLLQPEHFISALKDCKSQILFLRHVAKSPALDGIFADALIIRVAYRFQLDRYGVDEDDGPDSISPSGTDSVIEDRASANEVDMPMDDADLYEGPVSIHGELPMTAAVAEDSTSAFNYESETESDFSDEYKDIPEQHADSIHAEYTHTTAPNAAYMYTTALPVRTSGEPGAGDVWLHHNWLHDSSLGPLPTLTDGETVTLDAHEKFRSWAECIQIVAAKDPEAYIYHPIMGDPLHAALFVRRLEYEKLPDLSLNLQHLLWSLEHGLIDPAEIVKRLCRRLYTTHQHRLSHTLQILAHVATVYDDLPDTTIDIGVLNRPVIERRWAQKITDSHQVFGGRNPILRARAFSMISYFESGIHDVDPTQLNSVVALSSADSLFVCRPLLEDPYKSIIGFSGIRRILGNIGKPGITFLLPPQEPMIRDIDLNSWRLNSYRTFDGTASRSFETTSLHLSFTEYHIPLFDGSRGAHDNQVSFVESVISVRNKGQWIADVDPLPLLNGVSENIRRLPSQGTCEHQKDLNSNQDIIAIDSWDELIDQPDGIFVVRTGDNWIARLALTLVAHQRLQQTSAKFAITVCPLEVCWTCTQQSFKHHAFIF